MATKMLSLRLTEFGRARLEEHCEKFGLTQSELFECFLALSADYVQEIVSITTEKVESERAKEKAEKMKLSKEKRDLAKSLSKKLSLEQLKAIATNG